ncbi:hypothetical protein RRG08_016292 [Elysia crispata]|uniref:Uncharacterized protein n=1 Tax=Elysia crispata TaxID=231223 RepID=A0AAE1B6L6_9GAST|nr:hypothetical protein RRG08_016292 [Elysia crispata]
MAGNIVVAAGVNSLGHCPLQVVPTTVVVTGHWRLDFSLLVNVFGISQATWQDLTLEAGPKESGKWQARSVYVDMFKVYLGRQLCLPASLCRTPPSVSALTVRATRTSGLCTNVQQRSRLRMRRKEGSRPITHSDSENQERICPRGSIPAWISGEIATWLKSLSTYQSINEPIN